MNDTHSHKTSLADAASQAFVGTLAFAHGDLPVVAALQVMHSQRVPSLNRTVSHEHVQIQILKTSRALSGLLSASILQDAGNVTYLLAAKFSMQ